MKQRRKVCNVGEEEGAALPSVLIIIVMISLMAGTVLMGLVVQGRFIQRDIDALKARYTAEGAVFQYLAALSRNEVPNKEIVLPDSSRAKVEAEQFGGFLKLTSTAGMGKARIKIQVLAGIGADSVFRDAVALGDISSALNLAGDMEIQGDIRTGRLGVKTTDFKGSVFSGTVDGNIHRADTSALPVFDKTLFQEEIRQFRAKTIARPSHARIITPGRYRAEEIREWTSSDSSAVIYIDGDVEIFSRKKISWPRPLTIIAGGNIMLRGDIAYRPFTKIISGDTLSLSGNITGSHGLFFADKKLSVEEDVSVSGQFIAGREISVGDQAYLKYPSLLYLETVSEETVRKGKIELTGRSRIDGIVIVPPPEAGRTEDRMKLTVGKEALVRGAIYNGARTELHGKILGSVSTFQFYFYHSPTAYINWIKDTRIDLSGRPSNFVVPLGFGKNENYRLLDWKELKTEKS